MLIKQGVDISRLKRAIRRSLCVVAKIFRKHGYELVITSTYDGTHSPCSLHYANDAYDVRITTGKKRNMIYEEIKEALGDDYDVILEKTHLHIEFDPSHGGDKR